MNVKTILRGAVERAVAFYREYPARSVSYVVAAIATLGGLVGVVVDVEQLSGLLTLILPILAGGEVVHSKVTPVANANRDRSVHVHLDGRVVAERVIQHLDGDLNTARKRG